MTTLTIVESKRRIARKALKRPLARSLPKKRKRTRQGSISTLKRNLDAIFSKYIRQRDSGQCYTCPKKDDPKRMQNGHFIPRQYLSVRYDETNCHCQCYACNMLYNGQPSAYALHLIVDYGRDIVEKLESRRKEITKLTPEWYQKQIALYTQKLEELKG